MKAIILCAGLGTRLKPWTLSHPKALVPVAGVPMLKRVADRLMLSGFDRLTINVHHFASQIVDYVSSGALNADEINISDESERLLDTGGGILNAERFLAADSRPFLVHNVDILSDADLIALYDAHCRSGRDVTLLVSDRKSDRKLVFGPNMKLRGWVNQASGAVRPAGLRPDQSDIVLSFSGIYVMSPSVFAKMRANGFSGAFPIMDFFLAGLKGVEIGGVCQNGLAILDIGKPDTLLHAGSSCLL